jgi:hypothetical protein
MSYVTFEREVAQAPKEMGYINKQRPFPFLLHIEKE